MTYHSTLPKLYVLFPRTQAWVKAEMASTEAQKIAGLHGRAALGPNEGMLFKFAPQEPPVSMTMASMLVPLDIMFIGYDDVVGHIAHRVRPGRVAPVLGPAVPWVLEVPAGFARKHKIKVGDRIVLQTGH